MLLSLREDGAGGGVSSMTDGDTVLDEVSEAGGEASRGASAMRTRWRELVTPCGVDPAGAVALGCLAVDDGVAFLETWNG